MTQAANGSPSKKIEDEHVICEATVEYDQSKCVTDKCDNDASRDAKANFEQSKRVSDAYGCESIPIGNTIAHKWAELSVKKLVDDLRRR